MTDNYEPPVSGDGQNPPVDPFGSPLTPPPPAYGQQPPAQPVNPGYAPPPQPPQMGAYYSNQQGYSASGPKTDPFAVTSMVLGIVGVPFLCCSIVGAIFGIIATVFGALSMNKIKKSNGNLKGKGMAIAGLVLGIGCIVLGLGLFLLGLLGNFDSYQYSS